MNYIFDMDGTFIDSYLGITNSTLKALKEFNIKDMMVYNSYLNKALIPSIELII